MGIFAPWGSRAATDYRAVNVTSGLSISGFDPVAYFTEGKALFGRPELELNLDGAVWRFSNEGNRGAFAKHPEVYSPRFGGYDPVAIGRGRSVPGHPLIWVVWSGSGSISSTVNRRAPLSSRIPDVLSIPQSANGPRLLATNASLPVRRCRSAGISPGNESRHPKVFGNAAVR
ncbi:MAG: YHS domain-containing (seleno)protein [Pseudolabrys sp.]